MKRRLPILLFACFSLWANLRAQTDTTAPVFDVAVQQPGYSITGLFQITWQARDDESGITLYQVDYSTDGGTSFTPYQTFTSPSNSQDFQGQDGLQYLFRVTVTNGAGLTSSSTSAHSTLVDETKPLVNVKAGVDRIGSTGSGAPFGITLNVQDPAPTGQAGALSSGVGTVSLTLNVDGTDLGTVTVPPADLPIIASADLAALFQAVSPGFGFEDGRLYDFKAQVTDKAGNVSDAGDSTHESLRVDNLPPVTGLFFTNLAQSFGNLSEWSAGSTVLDHVDLISVKDAVILSGPVQLLRQPQLNTVGYNFNQPSPVPSPDPNPTQIEAIALPHLDAALTYVNNGQSIKFSDAPLYQNLIHGDVTPYTTYTPTLLPGTSWVIYDDYRGTGNGHVQYSHDGGNPNGSSTNQNPDAMFDGADGVTDGTLGDVFTFSNQGTGSGYIKLTAEYDFYKLFVNPITVDRILMRADAYSNAPWGMLTMNVGLVPDDPSSPMIYPVGLQKTGYTVPEQFASLLGKASGTPSAPWQPADINVPSEYGSQGQLLMPIKIRGLRIFGISTQTISDNGSGLFGTVSNDFNGPFNYFRDIKAMAPALDMNLVAQGPGDSSNTKVLTSPGCAPTGNPQDVFDYDERTKSFMVMAPTPPPVPTNTPTATPTATFTKTPGPHGGGPPGGKGGGNGNGNGTQSLPYPTAYAEIYRSFNGQTVALHDIVLTNFNINEANVRRVTGYSFDTGHQPTLTLSFKTADGQHSGPITINNAFNPYVTVSLQAALTINYDPQVQGVTLRLDDVAGAEFDFGDMAIYGTPKKIYAGTGAPATFTSPLFDLTQSAQADSRPYRLYWNANLPDRTSVRLFSRSGSSVQDLNDPQAGYVEAAAGAALPGLGNQGGNRYFQYRVVMSHDDPDATPELLGVFLKAGDYAQIGTWISDPLPLSKFSLGASPPPAVVHWRSKNPTGTTVGVSLETSDDQASWSAPTPVVNGAAFNLSGTPQYARFIAQLQTDNVNYSPELHHLDFGFDSFQEDPATHVTSIVSGTFLFFTPLDSNSGVRNTYWGIQGQVNPTTEYDRPLVNGLGSGDYTVTAYSEDYAGNIEPTPIAKKIHISRLSFSGIPGAITNQDVYPVVQVEAPLVYQKMVVQRTYKNIVSTPTVICTTNTNDPTSLPCSPSLTQDGDYVLTAYADAGGTSASAVTTFTIDKTPPQQPTGITLAQGGCNGESGCVCLSWDPNTGDTLKGYIVERDGAVIANNIADNQFTDCPPGAGNHNYEIIAVDEAGNQSQPGVLSTVLQDVLVSDRGNNRVFELGPDGSILWQVGGFTGTPTGTPVLIHPVSAGRNRSADGVDFGKTLLIDDRGAVVLDTTEYPPYVDTPTPTYTEMPRPLPLTPTGTLSPTPTLTATGTPTPDPRVTLFIDTQLQNFNLFEIQKTYDGGYLLCVRAKTGNSGYVLKLGADSSQEWVITGLVAPASARELGNNDILIADEGADRVLEVAVSSGVTIDLSNITASSPVSWMFDAQTNGLKAPFEAVRGDSGRYYIADTGNNRVLVLDKNHQQVAVIPDPGSPDGLSGPRSAAEQQTGDVVVADTGNNRLVEYAPVQSGSSLSFSKVSNFTDVLEPYEVRQVPQLYRIHLDMNGKGPSFAWHPFVLNVVITDVHGQPVAGYPVSYLTDGTTGTFLDPLFYPPDSYDVNSGVPQGQLQYSGGDYQTSVNTDANGRARIAYFPTMEGQHGVTITSSNTQTLDFNLYANQPLPVPPEPQKPPGFIDSVLSTITNVVLKIVSSVASTLLNSVGIPVTINISTSGFSIGIGFDYVTASLDSNGNFNAGVSYGGATVGYSTQSGWSAGLSPIPGGTVGYSSNGGLNVGYQSASGFGANWSQTNGLNGTYSSNGVNISAGQAGYSVGYTNQTKNDGFVAFQGAGFAVSPDGSFSTSVNMGSVVVSGNSQTGVGVNLNTDYIGAQLAGPITQAMGLVPQPVVHPNGAPEMSDQQGVVGTDESGGTDESDDQPTTSDQAGTDQPVSQTTEVSDQVSTGNAQSDGCPTSTQAVTAHPVNVGNGVMYYTSREVYIPGPGPQLALEVARTYNNLSDFTGSFGPRWQFEYDTYLLATPMTWEIVFGDGHREVFIRHADGTATPWVTNRVTSLTFDPTAQAWDYKNKAGTHYQFNNYGRVTAEVDRWGNQIHFTYDPTTLLLSNVADDAGRQLVFTYTAFQDPTGQTVHRITQVLDPSGRVFTYQYDAQTDLVEVDKPSNRNIHYQYSRDHLLDSRDDPSQVGGEKLLYYDYDAVTNRVVKETNALGYSTTFTFTTTGMDAQTASQAVVTDARGNPTTYSFDQRGNWTKIVDPMGGVKTFTFDEYGNRLTATNALGKITSFAYDDNNNLTTQTDPMGNVTQMAYEPTFNQMTSLTNAIGKTWSYAYDGQGNLTSSTDPLSHTTSYTYTPQGRLYKAANPRHYTTTYDHDEFGNVTDTVDPLGNAESYGHDILGRRTDLTDARGNHTHYDYDTDDDLVTTTYADTSTQIQEFDARRNLTARVDENTNRTILTYDAADQLLSVRDARGGTERFAYDEVGNRTLTTDKAGNPWTYAFNANNWVTSISNPDAGTEAFGYDANGNKTRWTDPEGHIQTMTYDDDNHLAILTDAKGHSLVYTRDALGRVTDSRDKRGFTTHYDFDEAGLLSKVTDALGGETTYGRDEVGNITSVTDALGNITATAYDPNDRVLTVTRPEGDQKTYTYNPVGLWKTAQVTGCSCGTRTFDYNNRNRVSTITDELGKVSSFVYDAVGNQTGFTDANGHTAHTEYDAANQVHRQVGPLSGEVTVYDRNLNGAVTQLTDPTGSVQKFRYDRRGKVVGTTDGEGNDSSFSYNKVGKLLSSTDQNGNTTSYAYDEVNGLVSQADGLGHATTFVNDEMGNATKITDPNGHAVSITYDGLSRVVEMDNAIGGKRYQGWDLGSRLVSLTDENAHTTTYGYDGNGRRTSQTDPLGKTRSWTYDGRDEVLNFTDENGGLTVNEYDGLGRLVKVTNPERGITTYGYDNLHNVTSITDANTHATTMTYDEANRLATVKDAKAQTTYFGYDLAGRRTSMTDALGFTSAFSYDVNGRLHTKTDAMQGKTIYDYDKVGNVQTVTDPNGNATQCDYDKANRLVKKTDALNGEESFEYDDAGNKTKFTDADHNPTKYGYDAINRLTSVTDALGGLSSKEYDAVGNVMSLTDAESRKTQYTYDKNNRKLTVTDPRGFITTMTYDDLGNLTDVLDANGNLTHSQFDKLNRLRFKTDANSHTTEYRYDAVGNRTAVVDGNGHATSFGYDEVNRQVSETDAVGNVTTTGYDAVGNPVQKADSKGTRVLDYDKNRRLVKATLPDGKTEAFSYDAGGRQTQVVDWNGTYNFHYDALNRLISKGIPGGQTVTHQYDAAGNLTGKTDFLGGVYATIYDALNRPILVVDANKGNTEIDYDRTGHVLQYHHPNKTSINYTYDLAYNTLSVVNRKDDGTKIDSFQYAYDKVGNRLSVTDNVGKTTYAYDNTYQLVQTNYPDKDAVSYAYDKAGNRVRKTEGTDVTTYDYNPANMILRAGNEGFTFDGNGNMTSRTDTTTGHATHYTYDTENRMVGVTLPGGSAEKYGYDYTNMRISSDVPGIGTARDVTRSLWDGNDVLNETSDNHSYSYNVVRGVNLSRMDACDCCSEARMMFYHFDALGSVSATTDLSANITQQYRYDDFGKLVGSGTGSGNDLQFVGSLGVKSQGSTGLIYMRNRWYEPELGRWISKDPLGSLVGSDYFVYVNNNPNNLLDSLGLYWQYVKETNTLTQFDESGKVIGTYVETVSGGQSGIPAPLPNGQYLIWPTEPIANPALTDSSGNSWFTPITPLFPTDRSGFGIHPVTLTRGTYITNGCIGIKSEYNSKNLENALNGDQTILDVYGTQSEADQSNQAILSGQGVP